jgi:hypothetical protein
VRAWPVVPGVPAAGHVTSAGWWHPGRADGCRKCEPAEPVCCLCRRRFGGGVTVPLRGGRAHLECARKLAQWAVRHRNQQEG